MIITIRFIEIREDHSLEEKDSPTRRIRKNNMILLIGEILILFILYFLKIELANSL